jgi:DNA-binding transcriptional LysR family regulator
VVETGSFSKAAADLGVTQPTVTKAVATLEKRLGARLLNRNTRGVSPTDIGQVFYDKCKSIQREIDEADSLPALMAARVTGVLRVSTSVAFGRRVLMPWLLEFMQGHAGVRIDLSVDDRYVNLVEQGVDLALRMGRLADSSLGARFLGMNPWAMVASPAYVSRAGAPQKPNELARHDCLVYSTVQGDDVWHLTDRRGRQTTVRVAGCFRSNSLSALLDATRRGLGVAILPSYVAHASIARGSLVELMQDFALPAQEIHAVYPSPKFVPAKVTSLVAFLADRFHGEWWKDAALTQSM